jgi:hypothetical protein
LHEARKLLSKKRTRVVCAVKGSDVANDVFCR